MRTTLWDMLCGVVDRRGRKGRQLALPGILAIAIAAMLAGANDLRAIFRWGRRLNPEALALFGLRRAPCHATYHYVFRSLDADALSRAFGAFARGAGEIGHVAIDGKTLRGSRDGEVPGVHLVAAYAPDVEAVLGQIRVDCKTNEHKAALELLGILPLKGKVVIGDAAFCQRDLAKQVIEQGGDYVLFAKDNQPSLVIDIQAGFAYEAAAAGQHAAFSP